MDAKVKDGYRWNNIVAFSGHEYIKGEFRPVPAGCEAEAERHPALEVKVVVTPKVKPPKEPKAEVITTEEVTEVEPEAVDSSVLLDPAVEKTSIPAKRRGKK